MPFANYKLPQGSITAEQKEEIVHRTADIFASIYGDEVRAHTMVLVDEVADGGWGFADDVLTLAKLKARE